MTLELCKSVWRSAFLAISKIKELDTGYLH